MNVSKLIEMNKANQSYSVKVNKSIKSKDNILSSITRIDQEHNYIKVDSLDEQDTRLQQSIITITKDDKDVWKGNFEQLAQKLTE